MKKILIIGVLGLCALCSSCSKSQPTDPVAQRIMAIGESGCYFDARERLIAIALTGNTNSVALEKE